MSSEAVNVALRIGIPHKILFVASTDLVSLDKPTFVASSDLFSSQDPTFVASRTEFVRSTSAYVCVYIMQMMAKRIQWIEYRIY